MNDETLRKKMIAEQLISRGIKDTRVIGAMQRIPRHLFIPAENWEHAYEDRPVAIGHGQTISQPYIVALMTQALQLKKDDVVLEIGTGCGYQTAILAELCKEVFTIERIPELADQAKKNLERLAIKNVKIKVGDGTLGWQEGIFFDSILVAAAAPDQEIPLMSELKDHARMVIPRGDRLNQSLCCITRKDGLITTEEICRCVFVLLIGRFGWRN